VSPAESAAGATIVNEPLEDSVGVLERSRLAAVVAPEQEASRGQTLPKILPKAEAAVKSPYLITPDHVKRVSCGMRAHSGSTSPHMQSSEKTA
jgi:hypothetical protein